MESRHSSPETQSSGEPSQVLSGHVYVIDDNPDILKHLSGVLKRYGLTVETYADAESFLVGSMEVSPAVVLLDMDLPGMNGLAAHERLIQSGRQSPIIYLSGRSDHQQIIDALKLGANDFLLKPFSIAKLIESISKALVVDETRLKKQVASMQVGNIWNQLTERERDVCRLMLKAHSNLEIANKLQIMADTVKKHRAKILEKTGARNLADLIEKLQGLTPE